MDVEVTIHPPYIAVYIKPNADGSKFLAVYTQGKIQAMIQVRVGVIMF